MGSVLKNKVSLFLRVFCALAAIYLVGGLVLFDLTKPAYVYDEETFAGKEVAAGPRPRRWVCKPTHHDVTFEGNEWPFRVYKPLCWGWRLTKGYQPPVEER